MKTLVLSMISIAATVAAMTACTSESDVIDEVNNAKVEIKATAGIGSITTKAAVVPEQALQDIVFVRTDGTVKPTWTTAKVTSIDAEMTATSGAITFTPTQYYPTTDNAYFVGYYPKTNGTLENGVVTYTGLTGQEDIMYATEMSGAKADAATELSTTFAHKLTQIKFKVVASDENAAKVWGDITSITLENQKNGATLSLTNGDVAFTGDKNNTFNVFSGSEPIKTIASNVIGSVLAEAGVADGYSIKIATTTLPSGTTIKLNKVVGAASTSYETTITFNGTDVNATGKIGAWTENTEGTGTVK